MAHTDFLFCGNNSVRYDILDLLPSHTTMAIRASEAVVAALTSVKYENHGDIGLSSIIRKYIVKRGQATRPLSSRLGEFTEFSLGVPVGLNEILNQLLLLLSF